MESSMSRKENISLRILEKIAEYLEVKFDSVQTYSDLSKFKKENSQEVSVTEEIIFLSKKINIPLLSKTTNLTDLFSLVSESYPAIVQTKEFGWIMIIKFFGLHAKIYKILDSESKWISQKRLSRILQTDLNSTETIQWIGLNDRLWIFENPENKNLNYFKTIKEIITLEKKDIWAITIYSVSIGIISLVIPIGVQSLVSILNFGTVFQPVIVLTLLVIIALVFVGFMSILQNYIAEIIQQKLFVRLAATVSNLYPKIKHSALKKIYGSEITNYFLDISIIQKSAALLLTNGIGILLQTVIGLLVIGLYHPFFIIFAIMLMGIAVGIIFYLIGRAGIDTSIKESKSKHKVASWLEEMNFHQTIFRSKNAHLYANLRTENLVREYISSRNKHFNYLVKQMIGFASLHALGSGLLLGLGGWLVIKGEITLGQLIAAEIIVTKILDNFAKSTKYLESYYDLCASLDKVQHLLDFSEEKSGQDVAIFIDNTPISLRIKNSNSKHENILLKELNLDAMPGEIIVIQDFSKRDTSEFFEWIFGMEFYENCSVEANSHNVRDISLPDWRNHVSLLKNIEIISGTVADNVKMNKLEADSSEVRSILEKIGLIHEIESYPEGIYTEISRNGYPFIKEELALLMFARTFLNAPGLILIQEILRYLNKESLKKITEVLIEYKKSTTIIIASSLPEVAKIADRIFILKNGKIVSKGRKNES